MTRISKVIAAGLAACAACAALHALPSSARGDDAEKWMPLFNGKDLSGWRTMISGQGLDRDPNKLIQVRDGVIHAYADAPNGVEQPYGWFCTDKEYSHYRLRFQYKWGKKRFPPRAESLRDAGCLYHLVDMKSVHGIWPMCIECQVQEGDTGDLITVDTACTAFVDPATKSADYPTFRDPADGGVPHDNKWYINAGRTLDRLDDWNTVEVVVRGAESAVHIVNGRVNQRLKDIRRPDGTNWVPLEKGRIAFQLEGAEVFYKNIEIQPVPPDADLDFGIPADSEQANGKKDEQSASDTSEVTDEVLATLSVPEEFVVELAAAPPLVEHPMMACLDDRGRMFVAESDGENREAQQLIDERPHRILMLEDLDGDGIYDTRSVFADNLMLPNGAQWYDGALYVCSAPFVWRFRDNNNYGRADEATPIAGTFNFDGMSSAFHGPVLGPDGRLYWSGGQHGWMLEPPKTGLTRKRADPKALGYDAAYDGPWTRYAPGAFSCWPDGSDAENLASGGICNPVETAFTETGEVIGTISVYDNFENRRRDAIVHWIDDGVFNLAEKNYVGLIRTGKDLDPLSYRGHAAPSGIVRYRSEQFGPEYRDNFFFAEFNTHKVYRLTVEREGASFRSRDEVFLTSSNPDAHFTDVFEDADGSLLVVDTGGWFRYGCPTSQIAKPKIEGAIYRIRKKNAQKLSDPHGSQLNWTNLTADTLIERFQDDRPAVRDRAVLESAKLVAAEISLLKVASSHNSTRVRLLSIWALTQINSEAARGAVRAALRDADAEVRLAAAHSVAVRRDAKANDSLIPLLNDESLAVRREAATALGRIQAKDAVSALLNAARTDNDRFLSHAITLALIRIADDEATLQALRDADPSVRRTALVALDQMQSNLLTREVLAELLDSGSDMLEDAALNVLQKRPGWADEIAERLHNWLSEADPPAEREVAIRGAIRAFGSNPHVEQLVADSLTSNSTSTRMRLLVLEAIAASDSESLPASWAKALAVSLHNEEPVVARQAIAAISTRNPDAFNSELLAIAQSSSRSDSLRLAASLALLQCLPTVPDEILDFLIDQCVSSEDSVDRLAAAQAIGHAKLNSRQLDRVSKLVSKAGPLELPIILTAFESQSDSVLGTKLVESLEQSSDIAGISKERLMKLLQNYPVEVQDRAKPLVESISASSHADADRLAQLSSKLDGGDAKIGHDVFFSDRAACSACHRIGKEGSTIGPDLSRIGEIRTRRDLIEAIVFPSASFARGYEPITILTAEGRVHTGIISRQTADSLFVRAADRSEVRISRHDIDELQSSSISIMPQGLDRVLSENQLRDIVTYLSSLK